MHGIIGTEESGFSSHGRRIMCAENEILSANELMYRQPDKGLSAARSISSPDPSRIRSMAEGLAVLQDCLIPSAK